MDIRNLIITVLIITNQLTSSVPWHYASSQNFRINEIGYETPDKGFEDDLSVVFRPEKRTEIRTLETSEETSLIAHPLNDSDFSRGRMLSVEDFQPPNVNESFILNNPLYFEGDIQMDIQNFTNNRNAIRDDQLKWSNGRIPYVISNKYEIKDRAVIARAMLEYHEKTCIRFVPKKARDINYIHIDPSSGCSSSVGCIGGKQMVSLVKGCLYVGVVEHELMHAIGFWHEQSRADRDTYIRVNWENIKKGMEYNFAKYTLKQVQHLNESYDYNSLMHYGSFAFAIGSDPTITPLTEGVKIGQRIGLSRIDLKKINKLYKCTHYLNGGK